MTKSQLEAAVTALTEIIGGLNLKNQRCDALMLTLFEDGSGMVGRRPIGTVEVEDWHNFDDMDGLLTVFTSHGMEISPDSPVRG